MYILVGNQGHAALFIKEKNNEFTLKKIFQNLKFQNKESNLFTHRAGTGVTSYTSDQTTLGESNYKTELVKKFCLRIVDGVNQILPKRSNLLLIGGPQFIGELRKKYDQKFEKKISNEIVKNFYTENPHELKEFLQNDII